MTTATCTARCPLASHTHMGPDHVRTYPADRGGVMTIDWYWSANLSRWVTVPDADDRACFHCDGPARDGRLLCARCAAELARLDEAGE